MIRFFVALMLWFVGACLAVGQESAQEFDIVAVVDDDAIVRDALEARLQLLFFETNLKPTAENRERLVLQALRQLVDESVRNQHIRQSLIDITDEDIQRRVRQIEESNNMEIGGLRQLLQEHDIPWRTLEDKFRSELGWARYERQVLVPQIVIGDEEVQNELLLRRALAEKTLKRVREIFIPVENLSDENEIKKLAQSLIDQLKSGIPFERLARSISQSSSAVVGGDLGWIVPESLPPPLDRVVTQLKRGQMSVPILGLTGIYIMQIVDERPPNPVLLSLPDEIIAAGTQEGTVVASKRPSLVEVAAVIPKFESRTAQEGWIEETALVSMINIRGKTLEPAALESVQQRLGEIKGQGLSEQKAARACETLALALNRERLFAAVDWLKDVPTRNFSEAFRKALWSLPQHKVSRPIVYGGGQNVLIICQRLRASTPAQNENLDGSTPVASMVVQQAQLQALQRYQTQIRNEIGRSRLRLRSNQDFIQLKRQASIDVRL